MNNNNGRCAILLPHGILGRDEEKDIRSKLVESDLVECIIGIGRNLFYNSPMEACIIICKKKKENIHKGKILFIDAKDKVTRKNAESNLEPEHIKEISDAYKLFSDIEGFTKVVDINSIQANANMLSISLYVKKNNNDDYDFNTAFSEYENCCTSMHNSYKELLTML